ncbi:MAG: tRNA (guanosine(37)-N1)-methyltransferase TrmD [Pseudomonadota bacterium]
MADIPWTAQVLTLYPEMFPGPLGASITGRALENGVWRLKTQQIRDFASDRHRSVDDTPAGGGPGMVLRADIAARAIDAVETGRSRENWPVIYLSPRGRRFDQQIAQSLAQRTGVTLFCGRFEGLDERVITSRRIEEISLGDFVMTGGEIAAMGLIDACVRLIPRVLGNPASVSEESFSSGMLEHPHYTRPTNWEGLTIPEVLLSGHHGQIAAWRRTQAERVTKERRPDLWRAFVTGSGSATNMDPIGDAELSDAEMIARHGGKREDEKE